MSPNRFVKQRPDPVMAAGGAQTADVRSASAPAATIGDEAEHALRFHAVIPAETTVCRGQPLNVLLVAENPTDRPLRAVVRLYGSLDGPWRELLAQERDFPAHSHPHLYFRIPADRFLPPFWGGSPVEELALAAGTAPPGDTHQGVLVFMEPDAPK